MKNSPQHIDQLLEMLDGYLSAEIQGAAESLIDLSAAVWEVLQSLPTHTVCLRRNLYFNGKNNVMGFDGKKS